MRNELQRNKRKTKIARKTHRDLQKWKNIAGLSFIKIGKKLKKIKEEELYKYLGESDLKSFKSYVNSPEVDIEERKAYYLIQIYRKFCEKLGYEEKELKGIYWTKLRALLTVVDENNSDELVESARNLPRKKLELEVRQRKQGLESLSDLDEHEHQWKEITYLKCQICGETRKKYSEDNKEDNKGNKSR